MKTRGEDWLSFDDEERTAIKKGCHMLLKTLGGRSKHAPAVRRVLDALDYQDAAWRTPEDEKVFP